MDATTKIQIQQFIQNTENKDEIQRMKMMSSNMLNSIQKKEN